jgi:hypothetical protein
MSPAHHTILFGARRAQLREIAQYQHAAIAGQAPFAEAVVGYVAEDVPEIGNVMPETHGGRIFIDGRRRDAKGRALSPRMTNDLLGRLAQQRTALTIALDGQGTVDTNIMRCGYRPFHIPSVADRLDDPDERAWLIDATFRELGTTWRSYHLHPDFLIVLASCDWSGDLDMLAAVLADANTLWRGEPARLAPGRRALLKRYHAELGLTAERIRELAPDPRAIPPIRKIS